MDPISNGCRLCLDPFAEHFTTIDDPLLKAQMEKVFCFPIEPRQDYCSDVCQSCSYAISEFYQYSEKVCQNQKLLNGNTTNCDPSVDSKITFEAIKVEPLSDSVLPGTAEDICEPKDEVSGEEEVPNCGDDQSYESPPKTSQTKRKGRPVKRKLVNLDKDAPMKTAEQTIINEFHVNPDMFRCEVCEKKYKYKEALKKHILRVHSSTDLFKCDLCSQSFKQKSAIAKHMERHMKFKCPKCDKTFTLKRSLTFHMNTVHSSKDRKMICDTCGQTFLCKQAFARHINKHIGIKVQQLQCEICQRKLNSAKNFRYHMNMVHGDGDRKFQCDICQQKYRNSQALYMHKLRSHADPKQQCEFCGKKFKHAISLREHRNNHTGDVLYTCEHCGVFKKSRQTMYHHIKRYHPTEKALKKLEHGVSEK